MFCDDKGVLVSSEEIPLQSVCFETVYQFAIYCAVRTDKTRGLTGSLRLL